MCVIQIQYSTPSIVETPPLAGQNQEPLYIAASHFIEPLIEWKLTLLQF